VPSWKQSDETKNAKQQVQVKQKSRSVKTTNWAICSTKILSLAGPAKMMSLTEWSPAK